MRRYIKILLALLYLLQLPIIFRESVLELYKSATEALHRETEAAVEVNAGTPLLKRGARHDLDPLQELEQRNPAFDAMMLLAYAFLEHGDDPHFSHGEDGDRADERKERRQRERLIANLYDEIKKFTPTGVRQRGAGSGMLRLMLFAPQA